MIKYFNGTVFNTGSEAIVNTVNCTGVMGAGIALEFALRYPEMYEDYCYKCENGQLKTGKVDYYHDKSGIIIVNFPTKWYFKYPSKIEWVEAGLKHFADTYKNYNLKSVAFPKLGTMNGGLDWREVKLLMECYLGNLDLEVYICLDENKEAEGIEKAMLEAFNKSTLFELSSIVKLNSKQKSNIEASMPYKRFWMISKTESIGMKTYSKLFKYFYKRALEGENEDQISFII